MTRRLLLGAVFFLALLLLLPVVPCFVPVELHVGDRWLIAHATWLPPVFRPPPVTPYFGRIDRDGAPSLVPGPRMTRRQPIPVGDYHVRWLCVGRFSYTVTWFRGYR